MVVAPIVFDISWESVTTVESTGSEASSNPFPFIHLLLAMMTARFPRLCSAITINSTQRLGSEVRIFVTACALNSVEIPGERGTKGSGGGVAFFHISGDVVTLPQTRSGPNGFGGNLFPRFVHVRGRPQPP